MQSVYFLLFTVTFCDFDSFQLAVLRKQKIFHAAADKTSIFNQSVKKCTIRAWIKRLWLLIKSLKIHSWYPAASSSRHLTERKWKGGDTQECRWGYRQFNKVGEIIQYLNKQPQFPCWKDFSLSIYGKGSWRNRTRMLWDVPFIPSLNTTTKQTFPENHTVLKSRQKQEIIQLI